MQNQPEEEKWVTVPVALVHKDIVPKTPKLKKSNQGCNNWEWYTIMLKMMKNLLQSMTEMATSLLPIELSKHSRRARKIQVDIPEFWGHPQPNNFPDRIIILRFSSNGGIWQTYKKLDLYKHPIKGTCFDLVEKVSRKSWNARKMKNLHFETHESWPWSKIPTNQLRPNIISTCLSPKAPTIMSTSLSIKARCQTFSDYAENFYTIVSQNKLR